MKNKAFLCVIFAVSLVFILTACVFEKGYQPTEQQTEFMANYSGDMFDLLNERERQLFIAVVYSMIDVGKDNSAAQDAIAFANSVMLDTVVASWMDGKMVMCYLVYTDAYGNKQKTKDLYLTTQDIQITIMSNTHFCSKFFVTELPIKHDQNLSSSVKTVMLVRDFVASDALHDCDKNKINQAIEEYRATK